MDQTDFTVRAGLMFGIAPGAISFQKFTEWNAWISYPMGGVIGFFGVTILVFLIVELIGNSRSGSNDKAHPNYDNSQES